MSADFDLLSPAFFADPYPTYACLREAAPAYWSPQWGRWVVTRHADVAAGLRDTARLSSAVIPRLGSAAERPALASFLGAVPRWLFFLDPPAHGPARAAYAAALTPAAIAGTAGRAAAIAAELLDRAVGKRMDAIWDFACPLPATVLAELICPAGEAVDVVGWSRDMARASASAGDADARRRGVESSAALKAYFDHLVRRADDGAGEGQPAERAAGPMLSRVLAELRVRGGVDREDLAAQLLLMICAGNETTQHLIGNGLLALLRHRDQWDLLRERPDLIPRAVEELLRYDSPVQTVSRRAVADVEIGGQAIRAGDEVTLVLAAAKRDPARFAEPDRLDVTRADAGHVSLGLGPHYCVGAALARIEAAAALRALIERCPAARVAGDVRWRAHDPALRGLKGLEIAW